MVDDDEAVRLRVRDLLEKPGECEVIEAFNGPEGLDLACSHRPDLILLDIMMPGMSGLEVCTRLRDSHRTREIPIIVLSAGDEQQSMPAALRAGAEDYLPKPIPAAELLAKVATIMRLDRFGSLNRKRERLRWLVEHSRDALVMVDRSGCLVETNHEARHLFGLPTLPASTHSPSWKPTARPILPARSPPSGPVDFPPAKVSPYAVRKTPSPPPAGRHAHHRRHRHGDDRRP